MQLHITKSNKELEILARKIQVTNKKVWVMFIKATFLFHRFIVPEILRLFVFIHSLICGSLNVTQQLILGYIVSNYMTIRPNELKRM